MFLNFKKKKPSFNQIIRLNLKIVLGYLNYIKFRKFFKYFLLGAMFHGFLGLVF